MEMIYTIQMFIFIGFLLEKPEGNGTQCPQDVAKRVQPVKSCPVTAEENVVAAIKKACDQTSNKCAKFVYQCLVNRYFNETYEVCAPVRQIVLYRCAEFNKGGNVIQGSQHKKGFCRSCPVVYDSNKSYKYRECYDKVIRDVGHQETSTDTSATDTTTETTTYNLTTGDDITEKEGNYLWVIAIVGFILVLAVSYFIYKKRICRKDDYREIERNNTNEIKIQIEENENIGTSNVNENVVAEQAPLMTSQREDTVQARNIEKITEQDLYRNQTLFFQRKQRRRCLSENDANNYQQDTDSSQGIDLDKLKESTPLLGRKIERVRKKDSEKFLLENGYPNLTTQVEDSGHISLEVNGHRTVRFKSRTYTNSLRPENKREKEDRANPERTVRSRKRYGSESDAVDIIRKNLFKLPPSIPEVVNVGIQRKVGELHLKSNMGGSILSI